MFSQKTRDLALEATMSPTQFPFLSPSVASVTSVRCFPRNHVRRRADTLFRRLDRKLGLVPKHYALGLQPSTQIQLPRFPFLEGGVDVKSAP
jgi:hypothetical protein